MFLWLGSIKESLHYYLKPEYIEQLMLVRKFLIRLAQLFPPPQILAHTKKLCRRAQIGPRMQRSNSWGNLHCPRSLWTLAMQTSVCGTMHKNGKRHHQTPRDWYLWLRCNVSCERAPPAFYL